MRKEAAMNRGKLRAALIISLVFNVAVLGAFAFGWVRYQRSPASRRLSPERSEHRFDKRIDRLGKDIGLSEDKIQRVEAIMTESREKMDELKTALREKRTELADLLHADEPDEATIMAKVDEISALQGELERMLVQRLLHVRSVLDKDERERFMELIRRRMAPGRHRHPHHPKPIGEPGHMPPEEGGLI
jgi:Spy/CpxP family protein refolding chaperone